MAIMFGISYDEKTKKHTCVIEKSLHLDDTKCGFGHFYYAMTPAIPAVVPIWAALGAKHKRFHKFGGEVIAALRKSDYFRAEQLYREAELYSRELISDMEQICGIAEGSVLPVN